MLLYSLDERADCCLTVKALGHQWYWSYEYSDFGVSGTSVEFDSYIKASDSIGVESFRLLDVDNRTVLP